MKAIGIVLLVIGVLGIGGGVFGMISETEANDTIASKQALLEETFPMLADAADLNSIEDLVALDRMLKDDPTFPPEVQTAAWDILNAMGDREDMAALKMGGFAGGGLFAVFGAVLFFLGMKKQSKLENI